MSVTPLPSFLQFLEMPLAVIKWSVFDKSWCEVSVGKNSPLNRSQAPQTSSIPPPPFPYLPKVTMVAGMERSRETWMPLLSATRPLKQWSLRNWVPQASHAWKEERLSPASKGICLPGRGFTVLRMYQTTLLESLGPSPR